MEDSMIRTARSIAAMLLTLALVIASCKPAPGGSCKEQSLCVDSTHALICVDEKYVGMSCKGPDTCLVPETANYACSPDHMKALVCDSGKFKVSMACRGTRRCSIGHGNNQDSVDCDYSLAVKGEPCLKPGLGACSTDYKQMLQCVNGAWAAHRVCRGPSGCTLLGLDHQTPACDEAFSQVGDPCGNPGNVVCSTDQKTLLRCTGGSYLKFQDCPKYGCHLTANNRATCQ
jgi:hypothetical protein